MLPISRRAPLALLFALLVAGSALAQSPPTIHPGHDVLDTFLIRASTDSMAVYIVDDGQMVPVGRYLIETSVEDNVITRSEQFYGHQGELAWTETLVVEDHTLRPVSLSMTGLREQVIRVDDASVQITNSRDGEDFERGGDLAQPVFLSKMIDLVLAALPLEQDYQATLLALDEENVAARELPIQVLRSTNVQEVGGTVRQTWEVRVELDGASDLYHIDRQSGDLIRYESAADGVVILRW